MSRSRRKIPIISACGDAGEGAAKRYARKAWRRLINQQVAQADPEAYLPPRLRDVSSVHDFPKDGKCYVRPESLESPWREVWMRK